MPYDPSKFFQPQFQADPTLPQWQPMSGDGQSAPDFSPLVGALKKRMGGAKPTSPSYSDMLGGSVQGPKKGMQSL